jgi:hypothetical protein
VSHFDLTVWRIRRRLGLRNPTGEENDGEGGPTRNASVASRHRVQIDRSERRTPTRSRHSSHDGGRNGRRFTNRPVFRQRLLHPAGPLDFVRLAPRVPVFPALPAFRAFTEFQQRQSARRKPPSVSATSSDSA